MRGIQPSACHWLAVKQTTHRDFYINGREPANNNGCGPVPKKGWTSLLDNFFIYITNCEA